MRKIIFLDIDGVLNCEEGFRTKICTERDDYGMLFFPPSERLINKLIEETGAKVVISSTWRHDGLDAMQWMWKTRQMAGEVIDITPRMSGLPRGLEIKEWLSNQDFRQCFWSEERQREYMEKSDIENFIIIDDDSDMLYNQRQHFVHVKPSPRNILGFHEEHYQQASSILSKNFIDLYYE